MNYIPHTEKDRKEMLKAIGVDSMDALLADIPKQLRESDFDLPEGLSEHELLVKLDELAKKNTYSDNMVSFLGGGAYEHMIPSVVSYLASRGEFSTCYTPYQPEASQGTLISIFEYQSMICRLTQMDVANASLYDGASAAAEAAVLAVRTQGKNKIAVAKSLNPAYLDTVKTYLKGIETEIVEVDFSASGQVDADRLKDALSGAACFIAQSPNFFGIVEDMKALSDITHSAEALFVAHVNPVSLGILAPPGAYDADIAVGEVQAFGNPLSYGGPYAGFFAAKEKFMRKVPGRMVGMTKDGKDRRGFVLTLQTREQHIRREKATSNICSNEALCVLASGIHLSMLGKAGVCELADLNLQKAHYAYEKITAVKNISAVFTGNFFNEFAVKIDSSLSIDDIEKKLLQKSYVAGIKLGDYCKGFEDCLLVSVTETKTKQQIDDFVKTLQEII